MTNVGQAASAEIAAAAATAAPGRAARALGVIAVVLALLSALATFLVLTNLTPIVPTHDAVAALLLVNAASVVLLLGIIGWEIWRVVQARRRGRAGSRLHVRIVALFSLMAAVPAILVAVVASVTIDRGFDRMFSVQTERLIENAVIVAQAYLRDQSGLVRADTIAVAIELTRAKPMFDENREEFHKFVNFQAGVRGLGAIIVFDRDANAIDQADVPIGNYNLIKPSRQVLSTITEKEPQIGMFLDDNHVAGLIKLPGYSDTYVYIARLLDPRVVAQLKATQKGLEQFAFVQAIRPGLQIAFAMVYGVIALIVLLSAIWIGLNFANYLVAPIRRLIGAAQVISTGNLYVQVPTRRSEGDLAQLGESFNKMTQDLRTQRDDIVRARDVIDSRRRFTEAVLAGASAGVIGVDAEGHIGILNRSAERLIGHPEAETLGKPLAEIVPELAELFTTAQTGSQRLVQGQVTINRNNRERNLSVRVTSEQSAESDHGYVVTLDDITDLVSAQRTSAWADIARRIAHEIKNPLTPIQLSAERLRRKYAKSITEDPAVFLQCTDTIVRQVDDIKRMVDEFSQFARMPKAVIGSEDVADTVRQVVFLQRVGNADIQIDADLSEDPMLAKFDRRLLSQALTNIVKNATEAVGAVPPAERGQGHIHLSAFREGTDIVIDVVDNGIGLPKESRNRLLEPYVTTREKGTGLGLAIVGRIAEEHGGRIELNDASAKVPGQRGAWIRLRFSAEAAPAPAETEPKPQQLATVSHDR
ncbi:MAG TPA: PAS domain-containing sensor histidine kinase [Xanthobacteraceae bacterium]|nr:PAS domain-containing sensor histidine kinase [Xanthobacteraceae bacterium]